MSWLITGSEKTPVDPIFNNVSLLLHGNQSGGQFVDSSLSPKTITTVGNTTPGSPGGGTPVYPSGNSAFGSAIAFDGAGTPLDRLSIPAGTTALQFGAQDFTIECWVYRLDTNTGTVAIGQTDLASAVGSSWVLYVSSSTTSDVYIQSSGFGVASPNPATNTWAHVALTRSGGTLRSFLNGAVVGTNASLGTNAINNGASTYPNTIGSLDTNIRGLNGYIDDLRITKGVARYTANFTPPTAPFPDI